MTTNTELSDEQILEVAGEWFVTGENQCRQGEYFYRSLGAPTNVREGDLVKFARAILSAVSRSEVGEPVAERLRRIALNADCLSDLQDDCMELARQLESASPLPQEGKALTDVQIFDLLPDLQSGWTLATFGLWVARAVERAHGIHPSPTLKESSEAQGEQQ